MDLRVFGLVHWVYLLITIPLSVVGLICAKKFAKSEKSQKIILKSIAGMLLIWILINRLSQVFRYSQVRWEQIIPDSFCGMTSLVLSLAVLIGKKDNIVLHFAWFLALVGAAITIAYPTFLNQGSTVFYLPTISGLLHHSLALVMVVALLLFNQIHITYKKWYSTVFGFTAYFTVGAFQMSVFGFSDAFHIVEPMLSGTPLTAWFIAPIYLVGYSVVLLVIELVRKYKKNNKKADKWFMNIEILHMIEGAKQAKGCAVIIDVFRAFTVEAYLINNGATKVIPVGDKQLAYDLKQKDNDIVLIGERHGEILPGFDFGNSPSQLENINFCNKVVVHTTSAGTQGIANANNADVILTGSLVNAKAIATYIKQQNFKHVSLVCMGLEATQQTEEDNLCAKYIKDLLENNDTNYLTDEIEKLKQTSGAKFFDKTQQSVFPQKDFYLSTQVNKFNFVLKVNKTPQFDIVEKIDLT